MKIIQWYSQLNGIEFLLVHKKNILLEIERRGFTAYNTYNQVDFVKERVAVEVQFGKYFAVQYNAIVREGRSNPSVPLVLIGIEP